MNTYNISLQTTSGSISLTIPLGTSILGGLQSHQIPLSGVLLLDALGNPLSSTYRPEKSGEEVHAISMRNCDFDLIAPVSRVLTDENFISEFITASPDGRRAIEQFARDEILGQVAAAVGDTLVDHGALFEGAELQIALSPGGDGRILAEALAAFRDRNPGLSINAVVCAVGFEDEAEHLREGEALAEKYNLPVDVYSSVRAGELLGLDKSLEEIGQLYETRFPHNEREVLLSYWVQQINLAAARANDRYHIMFGYNRDDVLADYLYHTVMGRAFERFPTRYLDGIAILAPLYSTPKKLIDAVDIANSKRNYQLRPRSVAPLRSALYLATYYIQDQLPHLAETLLRGPGIDGTDPIEHWLRTLGHDPRRGT